MWLVGHAPRAKSRVEKGDRLDLDEEKKKEERGESSTPCQSREDWTVVLFGT